MRTRPLGDRCVRVRRRARRLPRSARARPKSAARWTMSSARGSAARAGKRARGGSVAATGMTRGVSRPEPFDGIASVAEPRGVVRVVEDARECRIGSPVLTDPVAAHVVGPTASGASQRSVAPSAVRVAHPAPRVSVGARLSAARGTLVARATSRTVRLVLARGLTSDSATRPERCREWRAFLIPPPGTPASNRGLAAMCAPARATAGVTGRLLHSAPRVVS